MKRTVLISGFLAMSLFSAGLVEAKPASSYLTANEIKQIKSSAVRAKYLSGDAPVYPDAAKNLGHQGNLMLKGSVSVSGALSNLTVVESSLSPILDAAALDAVSKYKFKSAENKDGQPMALSVLIPIEFYKYKSTDGGLISYTCKDFLIDANWWQQAHNDPEFKEYELKNMLVGFETLSQPGGIGNVDSLLKNMAKMKKKWVKTFDKCETKPDALMLKTYDKKLFKIAKAMN